MREEKAITLVSLVVTIIVLILLAGVSINLVIGDNGIIKTAQKSKQNVQDMITDKQTKLNELYTQEEERQENTAAEEFIKLKQFKVKMAEAINDLTKSKTNLDFNSETEEFEESIGKMLYTLTEDADAQASDIAEGKTAYVDGNKIIGTGVFDNSEYELVETKILYQGTRLPSKKVTFTLDEGNYCIVIANPTTGGTSDNIKVIFGTATAQDVSIDNGEITTIKVGSGLSLSNVKVNGGGATITVTCYTNSTNSNSIYLQNITAFIFQ